ncbi:arf-GAP with SH3 domain, ANK repeat and PH domain-containing protein 2-like isoform X2 [Styela clava]|uniref:arf-GAP with SH3 domain, ANK repeat and PH domain-containing protein 2-like isoform X2 n=1 Tax=Styela clava TaxID=7725 RepID=UPI001939CDC1|nr:arf-GAP with SH3 domain, ANK repeat and PH domain-containing protein 2-like isoform X2 [Styela clava]
MSAGISIIEFLAETKEDFSSPTTSTFTSKMSLCRSTISALEESLDSDRSALKKMKNAVKAMYNSGSAHSANEGVFIENLERLGSQAMNMKEPEPDIGSAFLKLAVFTKELTSLLKNLVTSINNIIMFPLDSLLKGDLKGIKGDMKRPFDKSWKDYDTKVKTVEREKRQLAKEAGMIRNEISGGEIAEEMEKERRMFQLQMCEYLIKANEIKTKKGVDLLQHLIDYYHAQNTFFSEGCRVTEHFKSYATELSANLHSIRQSQDEERRQLVELRNLLRTSVGDSNSSKSSASVYNLHQLQGLKEFGNEKVGYLMKRSEGLRKAWQKRKCTVSDGYLTISHNNANKAPVKLNLLTSQVKPVAEDKKIFDLVSHNRTYRFMADDESESIAWVSVISNSKEDALNRVFGEEGSSKQQNSGLRELTKSILDEVKHLTGNDRCCDCGAAEPTWLSTNLGVLTCIECSGIHRDMGVHISRIQSITLDELGTSELLVARAVGNASFNEIMESQLDLRDKPTQESDMETRKSFIRDKYEIHRYAMHTCMDDPDRLLEDLMQAIISKDICALLQVFAEGVDLSSPLPGYSNGETALHLAIKQEDRSSLFIVDFLVQNSSASLDRQTISDGNTPLHLCAEYNKSECMKLLLRTRARTDLKNTAGEKPVDTARRTRNSSCEEILTQAASGKFHPIVHVDVDWNFSFVEEDDEFDFVADNSDDELDGQTGQEKSATLGPHYNSPFKSGPGSHARPVSALNPIMPMGSMSTPENSVKHRQTFRDRQKPIVPSSIHSPSAPQPPPRLDKVMHPSSSVQNISRSRSRTVAPTASLQEHKRTSSDSRSNFSNVLPSSNQQNQKQHPGITNALESILQNRGPPGRGGPPPLPPHNPTHNNLNRNKQPQIAPKPEPRRDSMDNESSGKTVVNKFSSQPITPHPIVPPAIPDKASALSKDSPPLPRSSGSSSSRPRKVRAIYDCEADNVDELTFVEDEIIVVTGVEDPEWWVGHIEHQPHRAGVFPVSFVHFLPD